MFGFVVVAGAVVVDDQLTKALAAQRGVVAGNPALAFGVVEGPARFLIVGMAVVLLAFLRFVPPRAAALGIWPATPALIAGGMFANLVDRLRFGVTRDFILTPWATVNVADIAVIAGVIGLFFAAVWQMYKLRAVLRA
jgi:lipoprotein signal peptidase